MNQKQKEVALRAAMRSLETFDELLSLSPNSLSNKAARYRALLQLRVDLYQLWVPIPEEFALDRLLMDWINTLDMQILEVRQALRAAGVST